MCETDIPKITWATLTMQDSDGKVTVLEVPVGNDIEVESEIYDRGLPDRIFDGIPPISLGAGVSGHRLTITINAVSGRSCVPLVVLRGHG